MRKFLGLAIGASIVLGGNQALALTYAEFKYQVIVDAESLLHATGRGEFAIPAVRRVAESMSKLGGLYSGGLLTVDGIKEGLADLGGVGCRDGHGKPASKKKIAKIQLATVDDTLDKIASGKTNITLPAEEQAAISALVASFQYNVIVSTCPNLSK